MASPLGSCVSAHIISLFHLNLLFTSPDCEEGLVCPKFLFPPPAMSVMKETTSLYSLTPLLMQLSSSQVLGDQCFFHRATLGTHHQGGSWVCWDDNEAILPCLLSGASHNFCLVAHTRLVKLNSNREFQRQRLTILISIK